MKRRMRANVSRRKKRLRRTQKTRIKNKTELLVLLSWFLAEGELFSKGEFHGNVKWLADQLVGQALIWSWQETKYVTDAFDHTSEICGDLGWTKTAKSYTSFMNALDCYQHVLGPRLRDRCQILAEEVGGKWFRTNKWVLIGFDGSRITAPRTISNEKACCPPNYGQGQRAKRKKKKSKGMRRKRNKENPPHPQAPQAWITMMWHMGLHLPWTWRLGPSNASERDHVIEILAAEKFPEKTLFCGDAGFTGYRLWNAMIQGGFDFVVRVGGNVDLLSEHADVKEIGDGNVLCWPKGRMDSGEPPLQLRLVQVQIKGTKIWLLTSVLDRRQLTKKQLLAIYRMRWGIEVEFRGLKQTIDKHKLRCRNSDRLFVELDWSLRGMVVAELIALREQIAASERKKSGDNYEPRNRSLASTMRAIRKTMRTLSKYCEPKDSLSQRLSRAIIQQYTNHTDKRARYRPPNPDKKPLGDPNVRKMTVAERQMLRKYEQGVAA